MGVWGKGLYENDFALDIKDSYEAYLEEGMHPDIAKQKMIEEAISQPVSEDDIALFWIVFADLQHQTGCLDASVKKKALFYLRSYQPKDAYSIMRQIDASEWSKVIKKLSGQSSILKRTTPISNEDCVASWKNGDTFALRMESNYAKSKNIAGAILLITKIGEYEYKKNKFFPIVYTKISKNGTIPSNKDAFDQLEFIQTGVRLYEDRFLPWNGTKSFQEQIAEKSKSGFIRDAYGHLPQYRAVIRSSPCTNVSAPFVFIGNFIDLLPPYGEFIPEATSMSHILIEKLESMLLDCYCWFNLRESPLYR